MSKLKTFYEENKENIDTFKGIVIVITGFLFYGITSVIYMHNKHYNYYSSILFYISVVVMVIGFVLWFQWLVEETKRDKEFSDTTPSKKG